MTTKVPAYTVSWTSALSGNRCSSSCSTKQQALREANALFIEGARYIEVSKFTSNGAADIDWRKSRRNM